MLNIRILYGLLVGGFMVACTEEIPLELPSEDQQIVATSLISNENPIHLYLGKTISISDTLYPILDRAHVTLKNKENNQLIDSLRYQKDEHYYKGQHILSLFNTPLLLEITVENKLLTASTYIPSPIQLQSARRIWPSGFDEYGDALTEYQVSFFDPPEEQNYYELFFFSYAYNEAAERETTSFHSNEQLAYIDPVIRAEGLEEYGNKSLLFSDQLFNGDLAKLVFKYLPNLSDGDIRSLIDPQLLENQKHYALLRSVSQEYYNYRKAWTIHRYTQQREPAALQDDPLLEDFSRFLFVGDPVEMSNAIEGGIGVFAGYSQTLQELDGD